MSETTDPEVCPLITNVCKPPKNFPKTEQPFRFVWFEALPWVCYSRWEYRTYSLTFVFYGHKNVEKSSWQTAVKTYRKKSKCSNWNTQKETNIIL